MKKRIELIAQVYVKSIFHYPKLKASSIFKFEIMQSHNLLLKKSLTIIIFMNFPITLEMKRQNQQTSHMKEKLEYKMLLSFSDESLNLLARERIKIVQDLANL